MYIFIVSIPVPLLQKPHWSVIIINTSILRLPIYIFIVSVPVLLITVATVLGQPAEAASAA